MASNGRSQNPAHSRGPTAPAGDRANVYSKGVSRYGLGNVTPAGEGVRWSMVDPQAIWDAIVAVTANGDALMFSTTADEGAFSITIMSGGKSDKAWPKDVEGVHALLQQIVEHAG